MTVIVSLFLACEHRREYCPQSKPLCLNCLCSQRLIQLGEKSRLQLAAMQTNLWMNAIGIVFEVAFYSLPPSYKYSILPLSQEITMLQLTGYVFRAKFLLTLLLAKDIMGTMMCLKLFCHVIVMFSIFHFLKKLFKILLFFPHIAF